MSEVALVDVAVLVSRLQGVFPICLLATAVEWFSLRRSFSHWVSVITIRPIDLCTSEG